MLKFDYSMQTRDYQRIESILIQGKDQPDAERKLFQMYHYCEVLSCGTSNANCRFSQSADIEELLPLIAKQN